MKLHCTGCGKVYNKHADAPDYVKIEKRIIKVKYGKCCGMMLQKISDETAELLRGK